MQKMEKYESHITWDHVYTLLDRAEEEIHALQDGISDSGLLKRLGIVMNTVRSLKAMADSNSKQGMGEAWAYSGNNPIPIPPAVAKGCLTDSEGKPLPS